MIKISENLLSGKIKLPLQIEQDLSLNLLTQEDASKLFSLVKQNIDYLKEWMGWLDTVHSEEDSLNFIYSSRNQFFKSEGAPFGIFHSGTLIGTCGYNSFNWDQKLTFIGYWLDQEYKGKGIMTKICSILTEIAFNLLGMELVDIRMAPENVKSQAIPIRLGFQYIATIKNAEWLYDHYVDHKVYRMTKQQWTQRKGDVSLD